MSDETEARTDCMHMVCCLKQVPDTAEIGIDPETNTLIREGVEAIANPYDLVAVELALQIRDQHGGRISTICMGPPQAEAMLRETLAMGADQAVLLSDRAFAGADTLATSYTLAQALRQLNRQEEVQLVLCGKQAIDGDTAQTGPGVATRLGYSQFTYVSSIDWIDTSSRTIQLQRKLEAGREILRGPLPALLTVELETARPRRASLPSLMRSKRSTVSTWDAAAIEADKQLLGIKGSPTWVRHIGAPPGKEPGPRFDAAEGVSQAVEQCLDIVMKEEKPAEAAEEA